MENNGYPYKYFTEDVPPDYQAWYFSNCGDQNAFPTQTLEPNTTNNESWSPILGQPQSLGNPVISTSSAGEQQAQQPIESPLSYSSVFGNGPLTNEQTWNYMYYVHLLSESQNTEASADTYLNHPMTNISSPIVTATVGSPGTSRPGTPNKPGSLYSTMLKKGLESLPKFMTPEEDTQRLNSESSSSLPNLRHNSYPSVPVNPPSTPPPLVSMPLDPITLNTSYKSASNKKSTIVRKQAPVSDVWQDSTDSVLNNSVNISCSQNSKCFLNVNNDFNEPIERETSPILSGEFEEPVTKQASRRKSKSKVSPSCGTQPESTPTYSNTQDCARKSKTKGGVSKTKSKPERGKSHKKRHSVPDSEEPSHLFKFVFQLRVRLGQLPIQPMLSSLAENLVSLMGIAVGLLWVFAMLSWDWAHALLQLLRNWLSWGWTWIQAHGGDLIGTLFLRIPSVAGFTSAGKAKKETSSANEEFNLPKTGEEAVRRLLKFKEADPYSILGVTSEASDEDIKRSYKSQAILVHPDKNQFSGAEEAFKILASAFEILGNPDSRVRYDEENVLSRPRSEASQEISAFLEKLKQNIEEAQSILGCQNCGKTHKRYRMDRCSSEARYCAACKDRHAAKEGDLWAETSMMGFKWHYYSYLDGAIYDVTEWVTCQPNLVSRVEANTHWVPCRLATPKNKNRNAAFSRMEDLKDLVNDLLHSKGPGPEQTDPRSAPPNGKVKTRRTGGGRRKK